jgi:hypothetical protein
MRGSIPGRVACCLLLLAGVTARAQAPVPPAPPAEAASTMAFRQLGLARTFQSEVVTEVLRDRQRAGRRVVVEQRHSFAARGR